MKAAPAGERPGEDLAMVERLRGERFDAAVIFTVFSQSPLPAALLCRLAGIPLRLAHCRENPYGLLSHWVRESEPERTVRHEVQRQLDLVSQVGAATDREQLSLTVPPAARERGLSALEEAGHDPDEPWVLLHAGASAPSRRYPHYPEAARLIADAGGRRIVLTGSSGEHEEVAELEAELAPHAVSLAGRLSFAELAGLISAAPLLVTNNSGPAHVAAAVGTPVVVLYALTNPQHQPWRVRSRVLSHDVPCRWCYRSICPEGHHLCLAAVEPARVAAAASELLEGAVAPPRAQDAPEYSGGRGSAPCLDERLLGQPLGGHGVDATPSSRHVAQGEPLDALGQPGVHGEGIARRL
jgi:lipopolysaccharide heptosyltransferase II